jgi:hypothetical protein
MGGGSSKNNSSASATAKYNADTVCILGVQGAGKSTVMKQFKTGGEGPFELPEDKTFATKNGIYALPRHTTLAYFFTFLF